MSSTEPRVTIVEHLRLIREPNYLEKIVNELVATPGVSTTVNILHESDYSCCVLEPWPVTRVRLPQGVLLFASAQA